MFDRGCGRLVQDPVWKTSEHLISPRKGLSSRRPTYPVNYRGQQDLRCVLGEQ